MLFRRLLEEHACRVVTIPIGYLNGFVELNSNQNTMKETAISGTEAVRQTLRISTEQRNYTWAFVGNRAMHHPHTSDARTCMTSFMTGISSAYVCHPTERDG